jgi:hypothetical protein
VAAASPAAVADPMVDLVVVLRPMLRIGQRRRKQ